jgi:hypothetical protein
MYSKALTVPLIARWFPGSEVVGSITSAHYHGKSVNSKKLRKDRSKAKIARIG